MFAVFLAATEGTAGLALLLLVVLAIAFYFLPTIIAMVREHNNASSIALTNFFFGWTVVGWVVSLVWAFSDNRRYFANSGNLN
jgi:hypothetical protein